MHYEILEDCTIRSLRFAKGQIILEGDFPLEEFAPWIKAGKVKQCGEQDKAPYVVPHLTAEEMRQVKEKWEPKIAKS